MKQTEISHEKYLDICLDLRDKGWLPVGSFWAHEMKFARNGKIYDLSAADLTQLNRIEREGLFLV